MRMRIGMAMWALGCADGAETSTDELDTGDGETLADGDHDGSPDELDCAPGDATIFPGAEDVCDGVDNDCDGTTDPTASAGFLDTDQDGWGTEAATSCEASEIAPQEGDCDDTNAAIHPTAAEHCDGIDEDCDASVDEDAVDTSNVYEDGDGDGVGGDVTALACSPSSGWVEETGDCDDDDPLRAPGQAEMCGDGVDGDCDTVADEGCPDAFFDLSDADVTIHGEAMGDGIGMAVAAQDLDGDGGDELALGAWGFNGAAGGGRVYVVSGPMSGSVDLTGWPDFIEASSTDTQLGSNVGLMPDGTLLASDGANARVYGIDTPVVGTVSSKDASWVLSGVEGFGTNLSSGDITGDGVPDLAAGYDISLAKVALFAGPITEAGPTALITTGAGNASVVIDSDLDGDGVIDLLVGDPYSFHGAVYFFQGPLSADASVVDADAKISGFSYEAFGYSLATVGDFDGDGTGDWAAGGPGLSQTYLASGTAGVLPGGSLVDTVWTDIALVQIVGNEDFEQVGVSVGAAGDAQGDGYADVLVGADSFSGVGLWTGAAFLVQGGSSGTLFAEGTTAIFSGGSSDDYAGASVGSVDLDGDGVDAWLVGSAYGHGGTGSVSLVEP